MPGGLCPSYQWTGCSWLACARVTNEPGFLSKRWTTPASGQGSYAVPMECFIPKTLVGRIVDSSRKLARNLRHCLQDLTDVCCVVLQVGATLLTLIATQRVWIANK